MLNLDLAKPLLRVGAEFEVWDGRIIGVGKIIHLF